MMPQATVVLPAPDVVPPMTTLGIMRPALPLDALLGPDARIHRVLELHHLGREVRGGDQLGRCVAAREHDVLEARAIAQRRDHVVEVDPAPLDRIRDLVEQEELVALLRDHPLDARPALARLVGGLLEILREPRPAVAHLLPVDAAERRGGLRLADLPLAGLDELEDAAAVPSRPRAEEHAERGGALALAVPGQDDDQRAVAALSPERLCATDVTGPVRDVDVVASVAHELLGNRFVGHAAVLGIAGGSVRAWSRAPAAAASVAASPRRTAPSSMSITCAAPAARPRRAAARATWPSGSATRPSVRITAIARWPQSRQASRRITCSASSSPAASGVRPPVGSPRIASAADSSGAPGRTSSWASLPRNATIATRSRRS